MIKFCTVCKTGKLVQSGSHIYCEKCSFNRFVVTADYIYAASGMLAVLISNTKFNTNRDIRDVAERYLYMHTPQLYSYIESLVTGREEFIVDIIETAKSQAINLQIAHENINTEEESRDLRCQCGHDDFHIIKQAELRCKACAAKYVYDEETGFYMPYFLCKCSCAAYTPIDESGLVQCNGCGKLYMHHEVNDTFSPIQ